LRAIVIFSRVTVDPLADARARTDTDLVAGRPASSLDRALASTLALDAERAFGVSAIRGSV
jgi:hypothetical protein